jgi:hypothetical protein
VAAAGVIQQEQVAQVFQVLVALVMLLLVVEVAAELLVCLKNLPLQVATKQAVQMAPAAQALLEALAVAAQQREFDRFFAMTQES